MKIIFYLICLISIQVYGISVQPLKLKLNQTSDFNISQKDDHFVALKQLKLDEFSTLKKSDNYFFLEQINKRRSEILAQDLHHVELDYSNTFETYEQSYFEDYEQPISYEIKRTEDDLNYETSFVQYRYTMNKNLPPSVNPADVDFLTTHIQEFVDSMFFVNGIRRQCPGPSCTLLYHMLMTPEFWIDYHFQNLYDNNHTVTLGVIIKFITWNNYTINQKVFEQTMNKNHQLTLPTPYTITYNPIEVCSICNTYQISSCYQNQCSRFATCPDGRTDFGPICSYFQQNNVGMLFPYEMLTQCPVSFKCLQQEEECFDSNFYNEGCIRYPDAPNRCASDINFRRNCKFMCGLCSIQNFVSGQDKYQLIDFINSKRYEFLTPPYHSPQLKYLEWDDKLMTDATERLNQCFDCDIPITNFHNYSTVSEIKYQSENTHKYNMTNNHQFWIGSLQLFHLHKDDSGQLLLLNENAVSIGCDIKFIPSFLAYKSKHVCRIGYRDTQSPLNITNYTTPFKKCSLCPTWAPHCVYGLCKASPSKYSEDNPPLVTCTNQKRDVSNTCLIVQKYNLCHNIQFSLMCPQSCNNCNYTNVVDLNTNYCRSMELYLPDLCLIEYFRFSLCPSYCGIKIGQYTAILDDQEKILDYFNSLRKGRFTLNMKELEFDDGVFDTYWMSVNFPVYAESYLSYYNLTGNLTDPHVGHSLKESYLGYNIDVPQSYLDLFGNFYTISSLPNIQVLNENTTKMACFRDSFTQLGSRLTGCSFYTSNQTHSDNPQYIDYYEIALEQQDYWKSCTKCNQTIYPFCDRGLCRKKNSSEFINDNAKMFYQNLYKNMPLANKTKPITLKAPICQDVQNYYFQLSGIDVCDFKNSQIYGSVMVYCQQMCNIKTACQDQAVLCFSYIDEADKISKCNSDLTYKQNCARTCGRCTV